VRQTQINCRIEALKIPVIVRIETSGKRKLLAYCAGDWDSADLACGLRLRMDVSPIDTRPRIGPPFGCG